MTLSQTIEYWATEKGIELPVIWRTTVSNSEFGHAHYKIDNGGYYLILINSKLPLDSVITEGVAWHEFCHCWDYNDTGTMGHGFKFWKKMATRPWLMIAPYLLFPITLYYLLR